MIMANLAQKRLWKVRIGLPVALLTSALLWPLLGLAADLEDNELELTPAVDTLSVPIETLSSAYHKDPNEIAFVGRGEER